MSLFVQAIVDGVRLMVSLNCCSIKTATITQSLRSVQARAGRWARWGCRGPHRAWRGHVTWRSTAAEAPPTGAAFAQIINVTIPTSRQAQHHHQSRLRSGTVESRKCGRTHGSRTAAAEYLAGFCRSPRINSLSWSATRAGVPPGLGMWRCPRPSSARPRRPTSSPMPRGSNKSPNRQLPPLHKPLPVRRSSILLLQSASFAKDPRRPTLMRTTLDKERFPGRRPLPGT